MAAGEETVNIGLGLQVFVAVIGVAEVYIGAEMALVAVVDVEQSDIVLHFPALARLYCDGNHLYLISNVCICLAKTQKINRTNKRKAVYPIDHILFASRQRLSIPLR